MESTKGNKPATQRITAVHITAESGGVGAENKYAVRRSAPDRPEYLFAETEHGVRVCMPRAGVSTAKGRRDFYMLIPWGVVRYVEYETPEEAEERELKEQGHAAKVP